MNWGAAYALATPPNSEATGTIHNTDAIPKAWIARFGLTVAEQVIEAVGGRMRAALAPGGEIALACVRIENQPKPGSEAEREARREDEARRDAQRLADWLKGETDPEEAQRRSRAVTLRDLLTGSAFALTSETTGRDVVSLCDRGAVTRLDGREGELILAHGTRGTPRRPVEDPGRWIAPRAGICPKYGYMILLFTCSRRHLCC